NRDANCFFLCSLSFLGRECDKPTFKINRPGLHVCYVPESRAGIERKKYRTFPIPFRGFHKFADFVERERLALCGFFWQCVQADAWIEFDFALPQRGVECHRNYLPSHICRSLRH